MGKISTKWHIIVMLKPCPLSTMVVAAFNSMFCGAFLQQGQGGCQSFAKKKKNPIRMYLCFCHLNDQNVEKFKGNTFASNCISLPTPSFLSVNLRRW